MPKTLKLAPVAGADQKKLQGRGPDADEARKFHVTLELRQVLKKNLPLVVFWPQSPQDPDNVVALMDIS